MTESTFSILASISRDSSTGSVASASSTIAAFSTILALKVSEDTGSFVVLWYASLTSKVMMISLPRSWFVCSFLSLLGASDSQGKQGPPSENFISASTSMDASIADLNLRAPQNKLVSIHLPILGHTVNLKE